jgi:ribonucleoside-diphosphate reductase beta chain
VCSIPELEALVNVWSFFETNLHSRSYSHIIRNIYNVPKEIFAQIHETQEIIEMASSVGRYYNRLHKINCRRDLGEPVTEREHIRAIWLALHASYALEALRFMVSFATSLAMVENKIFMGNGSIIALILQDELLHREWTAYIINQVAKDDVRFTEIREECAEEVYQMYLDVIREEKEWADYLFKKGPVIGLNANILREFVDFTALTALKDVGIKYQHPSPKTTPIPWFSKAVNTEKKQTALQEQESTSYLIGSLSSDLNYEELPNI